MALLIHSTCYCCARLMITWCVTAVVGKHCWHNDGPFKYQWCTFERLSLDYWFLWIHGLDTYTQLSQLWSIPALQTHYGICTFKSLLPPQGILCIKNQCFVALLYYCKTQFSICVSQGNIPKNARMIIPWTITNHAHLFNLMLNSCVQLRCSMKVSLDCIISGSPSC